MAAVLLWWFVTVWNSPPATLGEVAFREAVRRHHAPASTRVVNDDSLGPRPEQLVSASPPVGELAASPLQDPPAKGGEVEPARPVNLANPATPVRDAAWWRARMNAARDALARDRVLVAALESRVAALATDIAARDDPEQRAQLVAARQQALAELDRLTTQVSDGERAIATIEDEARKAGVPPGWIRQLAEAYRPERGGEFLAGDIGGDAGGPDGGRQHEVERARRNFFIQQDGVERVRHLEIAGGRQRPHVGDHIPECLKVVGGKFAPCV